MAIYNILLFVLSHRQTTSGSRRRRVKQLDALSIGGGQATVARKVSWNLAEHCQYFATLPIQITNT